MNRFDKIVLQALTEECREEDSRVYGQKQKGHAHVGIWRVCGRVRKMLGPDSQEQYRVSHKVNTSIQILINKGLVVRDEINRLRAVDPVEIARQRLTKQNDVI